MKRPNPTPNLIEFMATHLPPPDREAFEREIHDLFQNGDLSSIARYLRRDQSLVSKAFNPYDETRHNPVYEFVWLLWAMDCQREGLADAVLTIVTREREKWLIDGVEIIDPPATLSANVGHQLVEAHEAEMRDLPLDDQIREWDDVEKSVARKKGALIAERARAFRPVSTKVRETVTALPGLRARRKG